jgi:hypothetical protein
MFPTEHPEGHGTVVLVPWFVAGKVTAPQEAVVYAVGGQLLGTHVPDTVNVAVPNGHVPVIVPVHPTRHGTGGVVFPGLVIGKFTSPQTPVL